MKSFILLDAILGEGKQSDGAKRNNRPPVPGGAGGIPGFDIHAGTTMHVSGANSAVRVMHCRVGYHAPQARLLVTLSRKTVSISLPLRASRLRTGLAALLGTLSACGGPSSSASLSVQPPVAGAPVALPPALSRFSVPLEYDFTSVLGLVEKNVPKKFGSLDSVRVVGTDTRKHYAFEAIRGPFTAFADGNLLHLRATLEYGARGYYKPVIGPTIGAGCGTGRERPRIAVELATPISLTSTWHLASHARIVSVEPASKEQRDHCDVSILNYDVTARVVEAARAALAGQLTDIDRRITSIDLNSHVEEWWALLEKPIQLTDGVWLLLGPERLRAGRVRGRSKILTVPVSLDARPRIVTGTAEPVPGPKPLPLLARDSASPCPD